MIVVHNQENGGCLRECLRRLEIFLECFSMEENNRILFDNPLTVDESLLIYTCHFFFLVFAIGAHVFHVSSFWCSMASVNVTDSDDNIITDIIGMIKTYFSSGLALNFAWAALLGFSSRFNKLYNAEEIDFFKAYSNQILRIIPTILGCNLFILAFPRNLLSGPIWKSSFNKIRNNCFNFWWTELTYTQDMTHPQDIGLMPSITIPYEVQFFVLRILIPIYIPCTTDSIQGYPSNLFWDVLSSD